MGLQALQISEAKLRNPLLGEYSQEKVEEALKGPFLNFYHTLQTTLVPLALITETNRTERLEASATRGVQGPVVSRTRADNQMETCGVHLDGTLFLPAQGRTPRVPVKAAKGSRAERLQASSFICSGVRRNFCLSPVDKNYLSYLICTLSLKIRVQT